MERRFKSMTPVVHSSNQQITAGQVSTVADSRCHEAAGCPPVRSAAGLRLCGTTA